MSAAPKLSPVKRDKNSEPRLAEHDTFSDDEHVRPAKKGEEGEGPWLVSYADLMTLLMGFFALVSSMSTPDKQKFEKVREAAVEAFGGKLEKPYEGLTSDLEKFIKEQKLEDKVKVAVSINGIEMTFEGTLFFESGNYIVKSGAQDIMQQIAQIIKKNASSYRALIEGHTDSAPISHPIISSNWELSGLRASRIALIFEEQGFQKSALTIIGWGETKPLVANYTKLGEPIVENMAKNRRVVLKIYDKKFSDDPIR